MQKIFTIFPILFSLVIFTSDSFGQAKSNDQINAQMKRLNAGSNVLLEYDKSSDYSKLLLLSGDFVNDSLRKNGLSSLTVGMMYGYNGRQLTFTPDVFMLTFWAKGKKPIFAEAHRWTATLDGEAVELGDARYARKNGDGREFLNFAITRENLQKISSAKAAAFKIGNVEFRISGEQQKMFANLLSLSDTKSL